MLESGLVENFHMYSILRINKECLIEKDELSSEFKRMQNIILKAKIKKLVKMVLEITGIKETIKYLLIILGRKKV